MAKLINIPAEDVLRVIESFLFTDRAAKVTVIRQPDGKFTVET